LKFHNFPLVGTTVCRRSCRFERKKCGRSLASQGNIACDFWR